MCIIAARAIDGTLHTVEIEPKIEQWRSLTRMEIERNRAICLILLEEIRTHLFHQGKHVELFSVRPLIKV